MRDHHGRGSGTLIGASEATRCVTAQAFPKGCRAPTIHLYADCASRPVRRTVYRGNIVTIVAIDRGASGSGLVREWPALYQSAQTDIDTPAALTIPCLEVSSLRTWFDRFRVAV